MSHEAVSTLPNEGIGNAYHLSPTAILPIPNASLRSLISDYPSYQIFIDIWSQNWPIEYSRFLLAAASQSGVRATTD